MKASNVLVVAGMLAAFAYQPGECARLVPVVNPCALDVQGHYALAEGCPVFVPEPPIQDKDCTDPRQPCHYPPPAKVDNRSLEMRG